MLHFIVYSKSAHPNFMLILAPTLRSAVRRYVVADIASLDKAGNLVDTDGRRVFARYIHDLQAIECQMKIGYKNWTIRSLRDSDWRAPLVHVFRGPSESQVRKLTLLCRQQFPEEVIAHKSSFVWELNSGNLVTFYRKARRYASNPIDPSALGPRFYLPFDDASKPRRWSGDYDDILADLKLD